MSQVLSEELPSHPIAVLSGPTFATEVAAEQAFVIRWLVIRLNPQIFLSPRLVVRFFAPTFRQT